MPRRITASTGWFITTSRHTPTTAIGGPTAANTLARRAATVPKPAIDHGPPLTPTPDVPVAAWPPILPLRAYMRDPAP